MDADRKKQLAQFVAYAKTLDGDEKGEAQVFLDRLFRAFSRSGYKEAGAKLEDRIKYERGGTSFAELARKPTPPKTILADSRLTTEVSDFPFPIPTSRTSSAIPTIQLLTRAAIAQHTTLAAKRRASTST